MIKYYDMSRDEMKELTQDHFNKIEKRLRDLSLHYKVHSPENFQKFYHDYILTGNSNAN